MAVKELRFLQSSLEKFRLAIIVFEKIIKCLPLRKLFH